MGIFKREQGEVQQASVTTSPDPVAPGSQLEQQPKVTPPFVPPTRTASAPGVVPPPAASIYSMLPPEPAQRGDGDTETLVAEKVRAPRDGRPGVHESVRVTMQRGTGAPVSGVQRRPATQWTMHTSSRVFDPRRCTQAGLLKLAWRWQQAGAPIRAIHAYMELLERYPHTAAADAAVEDLVELSEKLANQGQFHIALGIYDQLEELL